MSVRLFIGNLPYSATEAELREHLSAVGEPTSIVLPVDRETGRPRGFAFVDYADRAVAEEAIRRFDQQPFKGRGLAVSEARPREERGPGGPRPGGFSGPSACSYAASGSASSCTLALTSTQAGVTAVQATTTVSVGGIQLTRSADYSESGSTARSMSRHLRLSPASTVSRS